MKKRLLLAFYAVFAVCFAFVLFRVIAHNEYFSTPWLALYSAACLAALALVYKALGKCEAFFEKHYKKTVIIFSAALFASGVVTGIILRYNPAWDIGAVHNGAIEWVQTGTFRSYYQYYSYFPNNLGAMAFLFVFFKAASVFGITDYFAVSVVVTSLMISVSAALASFICRRLADTKSAVFALSLFALSAQFWFMGGAVYTDSMSMMFPVLICWLYLKSKEQDGKKKIITYILMGLAAAVGSLIKITVLIMAAAIIIDMCFNEKPKNILKAAVCFAGITAISMACLNGCIYPRHLTREMHERYARPYIHWVMMGLKGDGRYNPQDYEFTDSFETLAERKAKDAEETSKRVAELGAGGLFKLAGKKSSFDFGDGTYGTTDFFWLSPQNDTKLHEWVISGEKHYNKYGTYATAMHIAIMFLMLVSAAAVLIRKNKCKLPALHIALLGLWLFLMCWETNRRYFSNFAPVIFVLAVVGMGNFISFANEIKGKIVQNSKK